MNSLTHSGRMIKAATTNVLILVAQGYDAQLAWTGMPQPFKSLADLLEAAGGSLDFILQNQLEPAAKTDPVSAAAESEYTSRLSQATDTCDSKEKSLWKRMCSL
eukprot:2232724-Rhodomonas_salina.1